MRGLETEAARQIVSVAGSALSSLKVGAGCRISCGLSSHRFEASETSLEACPSIGADCVTSAPGPRYEASGQGARKWELGP